MKKPAIAQVSHKIVNQNFGLENDLAFGSKHIANLTWNSIHVAYVAGRVLSKYG